MSRSSDTPGHWQVTATDEKTNATTSIVTPAVIIATGGFGYSTSSLLAEVAPDLVGLASTNAPTTTGDGIRLAKALGAATVDLDLVQVHPTGFSDVPAGFKEVEGAERSLILCAEIIRGAGSVILDRNGERFVDELDTRKAVTAAMNARAKETESEEAKFVIVVPPAAAEAVATHVNIYTGKGLLHAVEGVAGVEEYVRSRLGGGGAMRTEATFNNVSAVPRRTPTDLPSEGTYYVGVVQPVLHYTMGGLRTAPSGAVLDESGEPLKGLFAAGEVMGGVHGENRLGGSSLLDCVVFGLSAAEEAKVLVGGGSEEGRKDLKKWAEGNEREKEREMQEQEQGEEEGGGRREDKERAHVVINGKTYDLTDFLDVHPGGAIDVSNGEDLTKRFVHAHGEDFTLLDRSSIVQISSDGQEIEREEKFYENYGTEGGSWREFMGRRAWFVLHR